MPPKSKFSSLGWFDAILESVELLVRLGLMTGSGVAAAMGQFALAAVLLLITFALVLRVWRLRKRKRASGTKSV